MTDVRTLTGKALREEFARLRGKMLARIDELAGDDPRRSALEAVLQVGDGIVQHAARTAGQSFVEALAAAEVPAPPPVEDLFADRDPEEREQAAAALNDLLQRDPHQAVVQSLDEPAAPAQPARPRLPPVPKAPTIRRNENADVRAVREGPPGEHRAAAGPDVRGDAGDVRGQQVAPARVPQAVRPAPVPPRGAAAPAGAVQPGARGGAQPRGALQVGGDREEGQQQPAPRAPSPGRPAAKGALGGLKKARPEQRAEEPETPATAKASPGPRPARASSEGKPAFVQKVPPMEPGDEDIEF